MGLRKTNECSRMKNDRNDSISFYSSVFGKRESCCNRSKKDFPKLNFYPLKSDL